MAKGYDHDDDEFSIEKIEYMITRLSELAEKNTRKFDRKKIHKIIQILKYMNSLAVKLNFIKSEMSKLESWWKTYKSRFNTISQGAIEIEELITEEDQYAEACKEMMLCWKQWKAKLRISVYAENQFVLNQEWEQKKETEGNILHRLCSEMRRKIDALEAKLKKVYTIRDKLGTAKEVRDCGVALATWTEFWYHKILSKYLRNGAGLDQQILLVIHTEEWKSEELLIHQKIKGIRILEYKDLIHHSKLSLVGLCELMEDEEFSEWIETVTMPYYPEYAVDCPFVDEEEEYYDGFSGDVTDTTMPASPQYITPQQDTVKDEEEDDDEVSIENPAELSNATLTLEQDNSLVRASGAYAMNDC